MKVALASDHAGYFLKNHLLDYLQSEGYEVVDLGVNTDAVKTDYPDSASAIAKALKEGVAERGILVCGSGVGACIAANKHRGIYACIAHDAYSAAQGVEHDQMNVLCLGGLVVGPKVAETLAVSFLKAEPMDEERYIRRFRKVQAIEENDL